MTLQIINCLWGRGASTYCRCENQLWTPAVLPCRLRYSRDEDNPARSGAEGVPHLQNLCGEGHRPHLRSGQRHAAGQGGTTITHYLHPLLMIEHWHQAGNRLLALNIPNEPSISALNPDRLHSSLPLIIHWCGTMWREQVVRGGSR